MLRKVGGRMWTVDTAGWGLSEYLRKMMDVGSQINIHSSICIYDSIMYS